MSSHLSLSRPFASVSPAIQMLTLLVASSLLAVPVAVSHLDEWRAYSTIFDDVADAPSEFERFVMAMEQSAKLAAGTNVTCADCYKIHGGASGDCSSVFGCNAKLCDFCTNEPTCKDCWKINQGAQGSCCGVAGCNNQLCDFCTNKDNSPASCPVPPPPPPPPPPTPPSCPGGSLTACMDRCPTSPASEYKACVASCAEHCSSKA